MLEKIPVITLGINVFHADSSAAIFIDNKIIAAVEEERFTRIKHWAGFPYHSIIFCLKQIEKTINEVTYITIGRNTKSKYYKKLFYGIKKGICQPKYILNILRNKSAIDNISNCFIQHFNISENEINKKLIFVEHHLSHLSSAYNASPYKTCALLSIDGSGDFTTSLSGTGKDNNITPINSTDYPKSIGFLYTAFTQFLGFHNYGDEYKIMGLAPYGNPKFVNKIYEIIKLKKNGEWTWNNSFFNKFTVYYLNNKTICSTFFNPSKFSKLFGIPPRKKKDPLTQIHKDIAHSIQIVTEKLIFHVLNHLYKITKQENLCIAGGVAQNSVANGKIIQNTPFKNLYIPPAGHDAGLSIGSALYHIHNHLNFEREPKIMSPYLGPSFTNKEIEFFLKSQKISYQKLEDNILFDYIAKALSKKKVIGWFQGKAEFGPRALGNRSILSDPTNPDAKSLLNKKIKQREDFRPFAPSILKEYTADFFQKGEQVPYMEKVFIIKKEKRDLIPAVCHVDGSGRLQTVDKSINPRYYNLIKAFYKITKIPILLNTSFNENEPIVNSPKEAYECFNRTNMDILVLENCVIESTLN